MKWGQLILVKNFFFALISAFCLIMPVEGAVTMSASPIQGGMTLRFSPSDILSQINKEVRIRVTSTEVQQYQVFQRWIQPLSSLSGGTADRDFLQFYGLSGSNGSGTLYGNIPELIGIADHLVYTSSENGLSDNFVLVYQVDKERLKASGQFTGRILLTVRPVGSGQIHEVFLDVFVDADLGFEVSMAGAKTGNMIRLGTEHADMDRDEVELAFSGNAGDLRVYQEILSPIIYMENNEELPRGAVKFSTLGDSEGPLVSDLQDLDFNRRLLYQSMLTEDHCLIRYELNPDTSVPLRAGTYRGRIRYVVESSSGAQDIDFDIEIYVAPVFEVSISFPKGPVAFDRIYPGSGPQEKEVEVSVNTNLQKPYAVSQTVFDGLRNEQGAVMEDEYFLIKTVTQDNVKGQGRFPDYGSVLADDSVLFMSDTQGSPAAFRVLYRLVPYEDMAPGNYRTEITYTLGQI